MGKVSYRFLICLFNSLLCYIVLVNYLGWSGGYIDVLGTTHTADWENSYFGFQSVRFMLNDLMAGFDYSAGSFNIYQFQDTTLNLLNSITFGLPKVISWMKGGSISALDIFNLVLNLFFQPIMVTIYTFMTLGFILWYIFIISSVVIKAFGGNYNIPFENPMPPMPSESVRLMIPNVLGC